MEDIDERYREEELSVKGIHMSFDNLLLRKRALKANDLLRRDETFDGRVGEIAEEDLYLLYFVHSGVTIGTSAD